MIRYRRSPNRKRCRLGIVELGQSDSTAPFEKSKTMGSGDSMVATLKFEGIDGRAPPGVDAAA